MNMIEKAITLAKRLHAGQKRKDGKDYFTHLEAVAKIVEKDYHFLSREIWADLKNEVISAAYLHDSIEDRNATRGDFFKEGLSERVWNLVKAVSRQKNETYFEFIMRIKNASLTNKTPAILIKLSDLSNNMSDLPEGSLKDKYRFAEYILLN